jgi:hypothetical protein
MVINVKGIKKKLLRFKRIFTTPWTTFVGHNPRYDTHYSHSERQKCCRLAMREWVCDLSVPGGGKGEYKVNVSCNGKACPQCEKRYSRDSMAKITTKLFPGVSD